MDASHAFPNFARTYYLAQRGVARAPSAQAAMSPPGMSLLRVSATSRCQLAKFANLKWQRATATGGPLPAGTVVPGR